MKVGDLVKIKWTTFAPSVDPFEATWVTSAPGLVVDKLDAFVKVMFPERPGKAITFVETHLEVINEPRNN